MLLNKKKVIFNGVKLYVDVSKTYVPSMKANDNYSYIVTFYTRSKFKYIFLKKHATKPEDYHYYGGDLELVIENILRTSDDLPIIIREKKNMKSILPIKL